MYLFQYGTQAARVPVKALTPDQEKIRSKKANTILFGTKGGDLESCLRLSAISTKRPPIKPSIITMITTPDGATVRTHNSL